MHRPQFCSHRTRALLATVCASFIATAAYAYPLDGGPSTDIRRLPPTAAAQAIKPTLPAGARLPESAIQAGHIPAGPLPAADPKLSAQIKSILGNMAPDYGVAVLDMSDPKALAYGAHQPDYLANVGSVGKILVMMAWFQELADLYPDDIAAREAVLRSTQVVADDYIVYDEHAVPIIPPGKTTLQSRNLQKGDVGNLWEWMDWAMSASSNAAASVLMKELVAFKLMGRDYPTEQTGRNTVLDGMNATSRGKTLLQALLPPLERHGLDQRRIRQGSLFTRTGKARMHGTSSYATPQDLVRLLALIESGSFVDQWSSTQAKRLLYMTQRRIRYASHPVLNPAAVYFKSGSLYSCEPEPGFRCRKYMGNKLNRLASVAMVEYPAENPTMRYAVAVMSNVLRVNSAVAHQTLALRIHRMLEARHAAKPSVRDEDLPPATQDAAEGRGDDT